MRRWENSLLRGLGWLWLGEWDEAGFTQLLHLFLPDRQWKGEKPLTNMHGSSGLKSQRGWSVAEALLRRAPEEYRHWVFSSTEKQVFSNYFEMQTRRGLLCNISWVWGNLCYKSKLSLVDFVSFLFNQTPDCPHLKYSCFVTSSLLEKLKRKHLTRMKTLFLPFLVECPTTVILSKHKQRALSNC